MTSIKKKKITTYQSFDPFNSLPRYENPFSKWVVLYPLSLRSVVSVSSCMWTCLSSHRAAHWTIRPIQKWSAQPSSSSGRFLLLSLPLQSSSKPLSGKSDKIHSPLTTRSSERQAEHYTAEREREREREQKRRGAIATGRERLRGTEVGDH